MELRDKVLKLHKEKPGVQAKPVLTSDEVLEDAISALVNLGYKRPQAEGALEKVKKDNPDSDIEEMIRGALKILAR